MIKKFANIAVNAPVFGHYTYSVPESYRETITIGSKVTVRFRNREIIGFAISFSEGIENSLQKKILPIITLWEPNPAVNDELFKLTKWIANYYAAPLGEVISCALPRHRRQKNVRMFILNHKDADSCRHRLTPKQQFVINCLREEPLTLALLSQKVNSPYSTLMSLVKRGIVTTLDETRQRVPKGISKEDGSIVSTEEFTSEQLSAFKLICSSINKERFNTILLHGITGSGKTEIYIHCIDYALHRGKQAIMLVPEIGLTPQLIGRFKAYFKDSIAVLHSGLGQGERYDEWLRIKEKKAKIAIGTRSALFAPFDNLGVIVVDEEHDSSYKQNSMPFYNGRDCAVMRGKIANAVVLLGSATPSLESYYNSSTGKYQYIHLSNRVGNSNLPEVCFVDIAKTVKKDKEIPIISPRLDQAIRQRIENKEQTILFLNRRGNAPFIQCIECGHVYVCKNCSVSLTFHSITKNLVCHYCNYSILLEDRCPDCSGFKQLPLGIGTQRVEEEVTKRFPSANVLRMDKDTISGKEYYNNTISRLRSKDIDILIGTQMVTKGHDFPGVTLVGVIYADASLNIPDFRAAERTFNLLTQVSGRSGRRERKGEVIIQTLNPSHYSMTCTKEHNFCGFYENEIGFRETFEYPPFSRLVLIKIESPDEEECKYFIERVNNIIGNNFSNIEDIDILGPAKAVIYKIKNRYRWNIMLKSKDISKLKHFLHIFLNTIEKKGKKKASVRLSVDVDPVSFL